MSIKRLKLLYSSPYSSLFPPYFLKQNKKNAVSMKKSPFSGRVRSELRVFIIDKQKNNERRRDNPIN